ncbi:MAG: TolC family protein [Bacteroidota bacterium]
MKKIILILFSFLAVFTGYPQTQQTLTIDQAIRQAIAHNPLVEQATQGVNGALARIEQNRSSYYPTSDVDLEYVRLSPVSELAFPGLGEFQLFSANNYDEHISLKQTIYDFGKTSASIDLSQSAIASASINVDVIKTNIAYQTIQTFYAMLFLEKSIEVQDEQIDALLQHQDVTKKKIDSGTATDFDTLTTRVRITTAQNKKFDLQNDFSKHEATLCRLLGLPPDSGIHPQGEFDTRMLQLNTDSLVTLANQQRLELKAAHDEENTAVLGERVVSLNDKPSVKFNMMYGLKNGFFPDMDVLRGNWVFGLDANIPIFNGFKTHNQEQEAVAMRMATEARTRDLERTVVSEVRQALSDVRTNILKIQSSTSQVDQAKQALALANLRYETGVATNLDVIDAQTNVSQSELSHLDALYNYVLSRYALEKAVGDSLAAR